MSCDDTYEKQPADITDIEFDFTRFFKGTTDELDTGAVSSITGPDSALMTGGGGHGAVEITGTPAYYALVWLNGGTAGATYKVSVQFGSVDGRVKEKDFYIRMVD